MEVEPLPVPPLDRKCALRGFRGFHWASFRNAEIVDDVLSADAVEPGCEPSVEVPLEHAKGTCAAFRPDLRGVSAAPVVVERNPAAGTKPMFL